MSTHTPGPWAWRWKSGSLHRVGDDPYIYGDVVLTPTYEYDSGVDTVIGTADAALIKAAPDLFEALRCTTASLVAAISLLERGGKKAAPSDKMFDQMLVDYRNAVEKARAAWIKAEDPNP